MEDRSLLATFVVNTTNDTVAVNLTTGKDASGNISLRSAIMATNSLGGSNTITLSSNTYELTLNGTKEDAAASGDLDIKNNLTINGAGNEATIINARSIDRIFQILPNSKVLLNNIKITEGREVYGAGILNEGDLTLSQVKIKYNQAVGTPGASATVSANASVGGTARGGGVFVSAKGKLTLDAASIENNYAAGGDGGRDPIPSANGTVQSPNGQDGRPGGAGGNGLGGGIYNEGVLVIRNGSLVQGNSAQGGYGGNGQAGGSGLAATLTTAAGNGGRGGKAGNGGNGLGGGIYNASKLTTGNSLSIQDSSLTLNSASGQWGSFGGSPGGGNSGNGSATQRPGKGGDAGAGGNGGLGAGGGIFNLSSTGVLTNVNLIQNKAGGGSGGVGGSDSSGGKLYFTSPKNIAGASGGDASNAGNFGYSGPAFGGAVYSAGGSLTISGSNLSDNNSKGGGAQTDYYTGYYITGFTGGSATLFTSGSTTIRGVGGNGGNAGFSAPGGSAAGGAVYVKGGEVNITTSTLQQNNAIGGNGAHGATGGSGGLGGGKAGKSTPGAAGGMGYGGAITLGDPSAKLTISRSTLRNNLAAGGNGGNGALPRATDGNNFEQLGGGGGAGAAGSASGTGGHAQGGAISVKAGTLVVSETTIENNHASAGKGGSAGAGTKGSLPTGTGSGAAGGNAANSANGGNGMGGALAMNGGSVNISRSTMNANVAHGGAAGDGANGGDASASGTVYPLGGKAGNGGNGGSGFGGGVYHDGGALYMANVTIVNNSVGGARGGLGGQAGRGSAIGAHGTLGANGSGQGGGIFHTGTTKATLTNLTIARNYLSNAWGSISGSGGGIFATSNNIELRNTLLALNYFQNGFSSGGQQIKGSVTSLGTNLISNTDGSTGFVASDLKGTNAAPLDAKIDLLAANGGFTKTCKLLPGSVAINSGTTTGAPLTDQRGTARNGKVDIGAFEV